MEQLTENFKEIIGTVSALKSPQVGRLIRRTTIVCSPSMEHFLLEDAEVVSVVGSAKAEPITDAKDEMEEAGGEEEEVEEQLASTK